MSSNADFDTIHEKLGAATRNDATRDDVGGMQIAHSRRDVQSKRQALCTGAFSPVDSKAGEKYTASMKTPLTMQL